MAKNVSLLGANYPDVPAVVLPQTGGGNAVFTDMSDVIFSDYLNANEQKTFTFTDGYLAILCVIGRQSRTQNYHGLYLFFDRQNEVTPIKSADGITFDTSVYGTIKVTSTVNNAISFIKWG